MTARHHFHSYRPACTSLFMAVTIMAVLAGGSDCAAQLKNKPAGAGLPAPTPSASPLDRPITKPDKPLYSPFTARYLLDEVRKLRIEFERTRADLREKQLEREYRIARNATGYAQNAVELFFYIIVAVTTLLVFVGWNSLRDIHARVREIAEARVDTLVAGYSQRLDDLEAELEQKSKRLKEAQQNIDLTNEIHSLWLRASQENAPAAKIAIYDEILKLRPDDSDALVYKADAALQLDQPQWTLSLANRALEYDSENAQALYQRACAHAQLGLVDEALGDLGVAIALIDTYKDQAWTDPAFERLRNEEDFKKLVHS